MNASTEPRVCERTAERWRPCIAGAELDASRALFSKLAGALREQAVLKVEGQASYIGGPFVAGGCAGVAIALLEASELLQDPDFGRTALALLDCGIARLPHTESGIGLFTGLAGIAWTAWYTTTTRAGADWHCADQVCTEIERVLLEYLENESGWISFDLLDGLAGVMLYAVERMPRPTAAAILRASLLRLRHAAVETPLGLAWPVPRHTLNRVALATFPERTYPLGTAHGLSGVIAALARLELEAPGFADAQTLLRGAVASLLQVRLPPTSVGFFPRLFTDEGPRGERADASWCWGDPGVACVLHGAGIALDNAAVRELAFEIMSFTAPLIPFADPHADGCLCHGWAGIAHILNRFFQVTRDERYADAARRWLIPMLQNCNHREGAGGLLFRSISRDHVVHMGPDAGLLGGSAGVCLGIAGLIGPRTPVWDRLFGVGGLVEP